MRVNRGVVRRTVHWCGLAWVIACGGVVNTEEKRSEPGGGDGGSHPILTASGGKPTPEPMCGNREIESGEICDGTNLGGQTCESATMGMRWGGLLRCQNTCRSFDTSQCETGDRSGTAGTGGRLGAGGAVGRGGVRGDAAIGGAAGATYGDPHLFTADGVEYDFQAVGEFVLLED